MDRVTGNTADLGGGKRGFRNRDIDAGLSGTFHRAEYHNPLQEELLYIIEQAGLTPDAENWTQVLTALRLLFGGRLLNVQIFKTTSTYTPTPGTISAIVEGIGGGGGGGGVGGGVGNGSAGGGGGTGAWGRKRVVGPVTTSVTIGAGGPAAAAGSGFAGTATSFGALMSCTGGGGGQFGPPFSSPSIGGPPGGGGTGATGADVSVPGATGGSGLVLSAAAAIGGAGGNSPYGSGGGPAGTNGPGVTSGFAAGGYGAGGGGASACDNGAAGIGGAGTPGIIIIWEYA